MAVPATGAAIGSTAGALASAGVLVCAAAVAGVRGRHLVLAVFALLTLAVVAGSWLVAADALPAGAASVVRERISSERVVLWREAASLASAARRALRRWPSRRGRL